ncbi:MAG TPA: FAD-dependent oxidoreductase [Polyangiaceae bacterium]|nr:FAD-dependent oxidoreductase [Polyangiaceae bacterium]
MNAAVQLHRYFEPAHTAAEPERYDVIVIGGGQAGLSVGYYLRRRGLDFAILDASERVGDVWRKRWDSLKLFTPARFDALVGMPFPAPPDSFPTHEQMADYLEAYARRFELPVKNGVRVESLRRENGVYVIEAAGRRFVADQVVVAMGNFQVQNTPAFAAQLDPSVVQLHASQYKNPAQLREGSVLVAGAGNSGAEIAIELAKSGRRVWVAGPSTGEVGFKMSSFWGRLLLARLLLRFVFHRLLTIRTPMGRKARPKMLRHATPLIRTRTSDLLGAGVQRVGRVTAAEAGRPVLEDGSRLDAANVIWCTGFTPGFSWIKLPILDERGLPRHEAGIVPDHPGLYFVGLHFLYSMSSSMIHGVSRDAERITRHLASVRHAM